ncbi:hypothetical protein C8R47DRAFT_710341 [Mycena vitilis]|nr:hypothetical protein C8R47DRAFT_710341 [Mycena vitilis]
MAEILGLVASVLQLADTVARAYDYVQGIHNAPKEQEQFLLELKNLRLWMTAADKFGGGLKDLEEPLTHLDGILKRLTKYLNTYTRMTWPLWGKTEVEDGLRTIERLKTLFIAWSGMRTADSVQGRLASTYHGLLTERADVASTISELGQEQRLYHESSLRWQKQYSDEHEHIISTMTEAAEDQRMQTLYISRSIRDVAQTQLLGKREEIIEWFSPLNFFLRQEALLESREPATGQWLLAHESFKNWKAGSGHILWCRGMPGAGKTVLTSIIVEHLRAELDNDEVGVAVIYLNHTEIDAHSPAKLLASLWRQLVVKKPIQPVIYRLYEDHREPRTRPSLDAHLDALRSVVEEFHRVLILVDALDEYPEQQRDDLVRLLSSLGGGVNLMLTSRPHIAIQQGPSPFKTMEIRATDRDIRRYLQGQMKCPRLSKHIAKCPDLRDAIEKEIIQGCDGMFLLAKLQIESLSTGLTVKSIWESLHNLPITLSGTYDEALKRINHQSSDEKRLAWCALSWITKAQRPLKPSELLEALSVEEGADDLDQNSLLDMETVLSVCAGLVAVDEKQNRVRLIHYTLHDYLERIQDEECPRAHTYIAATCFKYLLFKSFPRYDVGRVRFAYLLAEHPLLAYAVEYAFVHALGPPEHHIRDTILSFLQQCSGWVHMWNLLRPLDRIPSGASLWITAFFGLPEITKCLLDAGAELGAALYVAIVRGHAQMAQILLGNRSYSDVLAQHYGAALQFAASHGKISIVRSLIEHSSNHFKATAAHHMALRTALSTGNAVISELLVKHEIRDEMYDEVHRSELLARCGEIIGLIMEHGTGVSQAGWASSGLKAAALVGHEPIVRLLVDSGVHINATDNSPPPLQLATSPVPRVPRCTELVGPTALLEVLNLPNPTAAGTLGMSREYLDSVLWERFGICYGFRRMEFQFSGRLLCIVEFDGKQQAENARNRLSGDTLGGVVRGGLNIHLIEKPDKNPLQNPCAERSPSVNRQTSSFGCLATSPGIWVYGNALQAASYKGHATIVQLLIDRGADVNRGGGRYGNALQAASAAGNLDVVKLLLNCGARSTNQEDCRHRHAFRGVFRSALDAASYGGHEAVVKLLKQHDTGRSAKSASHRLLPMASRASCQLTPRGVLRHDSVQSSRREI